MFIGVASETRMFSQNKHWLVETPGFSAVIPQKRYFVITRYLHVCDEANAGPKGQQGYEKIYKMRPFLYFLLPKFISDLGLKFRNLRIPHRIGVEEAAVRLG